MKPARVAVVVVVLALLFASAFWFLRRRGEPSRDVTSATPGAGTARQASAASVASTSRPDGADRSARGDADRIGASELTGQVVDEKGGPVEGALVTASEGGLPRTTETNVRGWFSLRVPLALITSKRGMARSWALRQQPSWLPPMSCARRTS